MNGNRKMLVDLGEWNPIDDAHGTWDGIRLIIAQEINRDGRIQLGLNRTVLMNLMHSESLNKKKLLRNKAAFLKCQSKACLAMWCRKTNV
jgi:hypothetical protein